MSTPRLHYRSVVHDSARWDGFALRDGDIVICTPPKCGTTWTQQICALLVFQNPELEVPLSDLSPWLDMKIRPKEAVWEHLGAQTHRRFIKTHTPLDGLPMDPRVTYLCVARDPRDVAISGGNHGTNINVERFLEMHAAAVGDDELLSQEPPPMEGSPEERFWRWVDTPMATEPDTSSLAMCLHHSALALAARDQTNVVLIHYADLKADCEGEMRRIARRLGIAVPEALWPRLVETASFESMRRRADLTAPDATTGIWKENAAFFHSGTSGQWREFLDDAGRARYDARVAELASSEVRAWVHGGRKGVAVP